MAHNALAYIKDDHVHELWFYYSFVGDRVWQWHVLEDGSASERGAGDLEFDESGALIRASLHQELRLLGPDGALGGVIEVDFGPLAALSGSSCLRTTSIPVRSASVSVEQDGYAAELGPGCP